MRIWRLRMLTMYAMEIDALICWRGCAAFFDGRGTTKPGSAMFFADNLLTKRCIDYFELQCLFTLIEEIRANWGIQIPINNISIWHAEILGFATMIVSWEALQGIKGANWKKALYWLQRAPDAVVLCALSELFPSVVVWIHIVQNLPEGGAKLKLFSGCRIWYWMWQATRIIIGLCKIRPLAFRCIWYHVRSYICRTTMNCYLHQPYFVGDTVKSTIKALWCVTLCTIHPMCDEKPDPKWSKTSHE